MYRNYISHKKGIGNCSRETTACGSRISPICRKVETVQLFFSVRNLTGQPLIVDWLYCKPLLPASNAFKLMCKKLSMVIQLAVFCL